MKNISVKFAGAFVAFAFAVSAVPASALTTSEIVSLLSSLGVSADVIAAITAAEGATPITGSSSAACGPFTADQTIGSQGAEVVTLQTFLEGQGNLVIPAGVSKGYFGTLTQNALVSFQAANGVSPAAGYFGPATKAKVATFCGGTTTTTPTTGSTGSSSLNGGEASLEDFNLDREDDAEEGSEMHVATIEFDVEDGDVSVNRVDITFTNTSVGGTADQEPWDVFETITLMVDGDEVASEDIDDEDDWLDNDLGGADDDAVFRLSGLDFVVEENDKAEIEVYLTTANNVDDVANADWIISVDDDAVRAVDGAGIQNYTGDDAETVSFGVDEEGGDEDIQIKSSSSDPDASTLEVEDNDQSVWHEVFVFKLEAEENDIDIDTLDFTVTTGTENYEDVVSDIRVIIDGDSFDDVTVVDEDSTTADLTFDIDKDATVDADDTVEVSVEIEFKQADGVNYAATGETIEVTVTAVAGEGVDDVSDTSSLTSE
jgi:peptidoglycan hydrolase-like protein with peptidoglycan-binding domain